MNHYTKLGEMNPSIHPIIKQYNYHSIYYIVLLFCQKLILIKFKILKKTSADPEGGTGGPEPPPLPPEICQRWGLSCEEA